jgi:glyoxylate reductase
MTDLPAVLMTRRLPRAVMEEAGCRFRLLDPDPPEGLPDPEWLHRLVPDAEGIISLLTEPIDRRLIDAAPRLKGIANVAVGYDNVDVAHARARGVEVTHTPGVLTGATADLAVGLILTVTRRIVEADRYTREGRFTCWGPTLMLGQDLEGMRIGLVGMGRIGQAVARRLAGFGVELVYASRTPLPPETEAALGAARLPFHALLRTADLVSIHLPLTDETRRLFSREAIRMMKPGAYLVNTARGPVVDEAALVEALAEGRLAGAGLDVFEEEPAIHPGLLDRDDVVLLPHIGSAGRGTREKMGMMAVADLAAVLAGEEPQFPVPRS